MINLMAVRDDFLRAYAQRRHSGMAKNEAAGSALRHVMPRDQIADVGRMLEGLYDKQFSINGRRMRADLIATGERYLNKTDPPTELGPRGSPSAGRRRWSKRDSWGLLVVIAVLVIIGVAAGHSSSASGDRSDSSYSAQSGVMAYGQPLTIQVTSFTDPAIDGSGNTCSDTNCSDHYAVVNISATNNGNSTLESNLPVTITAFGSDGIAYQRVTNTPDGDSLCSVGSESPLAPSVTLTYCAGFVLPSNVTVTRVEVSGNEGYGSGTVSWSVSDGFTGWSSSSG
jgi:hypothetical protein